MKYNRDTNYRVINGRLEPLLEKDDYTTPVLNLGMHRITLLEFISKLNFFDYEVFDQKNERIYFRNPKKDLFSNIKILQLYHNYEVITAIIHEGVFRIFIYIDDNFSSK